MEAKISRGSWCLAFGMDPVPSLEQVVDVLSAFGYDGIELAGFFDHATIEKYPDAASRRKLVDWLSTTNLEIGPRWLRCGNPSVSTNPGFTVWTEIPRGASSTVIERENASCACFDAE